MNKQHSPISLDSATSTCHVRFVVDNDPVFIAGFVLSLQRHLVREAILDELSAQRLTGAVDEALQNACFHGNLEVDSSLRDRTDDSFSRLAERRRKESPYRERRIHVSMHVEDDEVRVTIGDEGPGFDFAAVPDPTDPANLDRGHGRGLLMMRAFADEVRFNDRGNQVTLVKRRKTEAAAVN